MPLDNLRLIPDSRKEGLYLFVGDATVPIRQIQFDGCEPSSFQLTEGQSASARLRVLHVNDLHGQIERISSLAGRIAERKNDPHTALLTLSAGDEIVGAVADELLAERHAVYQLYSAADVDAAVLGNHDFDYGLENLAAGIKRDANFPVLAANLRTSGALSGLYYPAVLYVKKGLRIGVIGLATAAQVRYPRNTLFEIVDPVTVTKNLLSVMKPLCDLVVILSHLGYSKEARWVPAPVECAGDVELAQALPEGSVALIVGGHSHNLLNEKGLLAENIVNGVPIVQAGAFGDYLGEVEISVKNAEVSVDNATLKRTADLETDADFDERNIQPLFSEIKNIEAKVLGQVENITGLGMDLTSFPTQELPLANFITDGIVTQLGKLGYAVDFAALDASAMMSSVPVGESLTFGDWFKVMPYADTLCIYQITGDEFLSLLRENPLRMSESIEQGFLQFSKAIRYKINLKTRSIRNVFINGIPIEEKEKTTFYFATSNFTRELAARWENGQDQDRENPLQRLQDFPHQETNLYLRKILVDYIQEQGGITEIGGAACDGRLRMA